MGSPFSLWKAIHVHVICLIIGMVSSWLLLSLINGKLYDLEMTLNFLLFLFIGFGFYAIYLFVYPFIWMLLEPVFYDIQSSFNDRFGKIRTITGFLKDIKPEKKKNALLKIDPKNGEPGFYLTLKLCRAFEKKSEVLMEQGLSLGKEYLFVIKGDRVIRFV